MSASLRVASHEIPYVQECLRLGILAANARDENEDDWDSRTIEPIAIRLMKELGEMSSNGEGYVVIPAPTHEPRFK